MFVAERRLWLTADRSRLVEDGDPDAAFLFCTPGDEVPEEKARRYGLIGEGEPIPVAAQPEPEPAAEEAPEGGEAEEEKAPPEGKRGRRK